MSYSKSLELAVCVLAAAPCSFAQQSALSQSVSSQGTVLEATLHRTPIVPTGEEAAVVPGSPGRQDDDLGAGRRGVSAVDGSLWGYGRSYRAGFEVGVAEFTPAYGREAPRNLPLRFAMESVRRGATTVLEADPGVAPKLVADHVEYLRAGGVRERYECRNDGMELSFVFDEKVSGSGDLVVRMRLDTELRAATGERLSGLEFDAAPFGSVTIGAVTGIDAAGRRCAGWLNHGAGWLEMALPAEFIESAAWPLVLDPLVGNALAAGGSVDDFEADVAYDPGTDRYLTTYTFALSAADYDVLGQLYSGGDATRVGSAISIAVDAAIQRKSAVGHNSVSGRFSIAWQTNARGNWDIWARGVNPATGGLIRASGLATSARDEIDVAMTGAAPVDREVLVAWQDVGGVGFRACQYEPLAGGFQFTDIPAPPVARGMAISHHPNASGDYFFAWETEDSVGGYYLGLKLFDRNLNNPTGTFLLDGGGHAVRGVDVDAIGGGEFYLVFGRREQPGDSGFSDIWGFRAVRNGTGIQAPAPVHAIKGDRLDDESQPTVASLGDDKVVVGWRDLLVLGAPDSEIRMVNFMPREARACGRQFGVRAGALHASDQPRIASKASAGVASDDAMLVWSSFDLANGDREVYRVLWEGMGVGGSVRDFRGGCGLGGVAAVNGPFAFGNRDFAFTLTGANNGTPTLAACSLSFSRAPTFFRCGSGCALLPGDFAADVTLDAMGNGTLPIPVGCNPQFFGFAVNAQFVVYTPTFNPCGIAPVSVSNILQVVLGD